MTAPRAPKLQEQKKPRPPQGSRGSGVSPRPLGAAGSGPALPGQSHATTTTSAVIKAAHVPDVSLSGRAPIHCEFHTIRVRGHSRRSQRRPLPERHGRSAGAGNVPSRGRERPGRIRSPRTTPERGGLHHPGLRLAARWSDHIKGVLAFSPAAGEAMGDCPSDRFAPDVSVPALILRPASETQIPSVASALEAFAGMGHQTYVSDPGVHGSSMLNPGRVDGDVGSTWQAVLAFLRSHRVGRACGSVMFCQRDTPLRFLGQSPGQPFPENRLLALEIGPS